MGNKHLKQSIIPQHVATPAKKTTFINKEVAILENFIGEGNDKKVFLSIKLLQSDYQCFSVWDKMQMRGFWRFNSKIHDMDWNTVYNSASKNKKTGLAFTVMSLDKYPNSEFKKRLSPDITVFELRVDGESRVHGFRGGPFFFLCWLDRNHDISP